MHRDGLGFCAGRIERVGPALGLSTRRRRPGAKVRGENPDAAINDTHTIGHVLVEIVRVLISTQN